MKPKHILLAYSGGLDTSTALHFLKRHFDCRVTAYCANLGQKEDWERMKRRAAIAGADELVIEDLRETFIGDFVFPALKANASYERDYLLGTPLARPAIVKGLIEYARKHDVDCLSHGCTQKGNDQVRFEMAAKILAPDLPTVAPWRIWSLQSREDLFAYCQQHGIPVESRPDNLLSHDENLVHITTEGDYLESVANAFDWRDANWITPPTQAPDAIETITLGFRRGVPVSVDGAALGPVELVERLNEAGARNGVGFQDIIENRINGLKVRGVFENPALTILHAAHRKLEKITLGRDVERLRNLVSDDYGDIVYRGLWFSDERLCLQALIDESQKYVSGDVKVQLYKGSCTPCAVESEQSLYSRELVTLHAGRAISGEDATGFLNTLGLRIGIEAARAGNTGAGA
ncbi:argininosuccinate synthase [Burkholderia pseudomallei]|uniref:Argininosuccinate synthase n=7 Tax=Burkholderia pseudomallei TaxID=28450 RepID=ASSY_BURPS|nr:MULTISPECIES: argininosuccinate synthase [Burkholderia]Q63U95.1 RecName: Full=Argininosuccinate synthase; AltName: Full=Citrulline--aspartate ligase [Burkholderia pseudomallei K96243]EIF65709.1 argininosuccinate synthase [Burkholderia pseudomallei 1258a]KGW49433.1 argininosuccinate synthase [Burkholderia pseudomallei MSHR684]ABA50032.1 argininosuccinate synthase [Burkholderia pseudomallei 1710b]ABN83367.1 argininosuccinate synthase [Burkholderia pseudomallei 668]ABN88631.1 argininosuccinat